MGYRKPYERKASEVFGYAAEATGREAVEARTAYKCRFLGSRCVKPSQHRDYDSAVPFGACSVWHRAKGESEPHPYVICPIRFLESQRIFLDAAGLLRAPHDAQVMVIPEVGLPMGRIDYVLCACDRRTQQPIDFIMLEVMACSTTTTGDVLRSLHDLLQGRSPTRQLKYGINFRQVLSRMMVQVLAKAHACEKWNKRMVWAIQDVLYRYITSTTKVQLEKLSGIENLRPETSVLFFIYSIDTQAHEEAFSLRLREVYGGTRETFARILEPIHVPDAETVSEIIRDRIRKKESAFSLQTPISEGLARVARDIIREDLADYT